MPRVDTTPELLRLRPRSGHVRSVADWPAFYNEVFKYDRPCFFIDGLA